MRPVAMALVAASVMALAGLGRAAAADAGGILYTHNVRGTLSIWQLGGDGADGHQLIASGSQPTGRPTGRASRSTKQVVGTERRQQHRHR